jgi:SnoaL-like domain
VLAGALVPKLQRTEMTGENSMTLEERLDALERQLKDLTDRQEILDCIVRTSRGNDRFDADWIAGSYHPDGIHELGRKQISGTQYAEHANEAHGRICEANLHNVTMHACEIDGNVAHAESYVIGLFLDKGCETSRILAGRYIDRLERRDGRWKIVVRRATVEIPLEGRAILPNRKTVHGSGYLKGSRDRTDPAYQRPLVAEDGERW